MTIKRHSARASIPAALAAVFLGSVASSGAFAQEPSIVKAVAPEYPRAAERRSLEGVVQVSIDIDAEGNVLDVKVVSATPAGIFDSSAINAVMLWKFETGKPTSGIVKSIKFSMAG